MQNVVARFLIYCYGNAISIDDWCLSTLIAGYQKFRTDLYIRALVRLYELLFVSLYRQYHNEKYVPGICYSILNSSIYIMYKTTLL